MERLTYATAHNEVERPDHSTQCQANNQAQAQRKQHRYQREDRQIDP